MSSRIEEFYDRFASHFIEDMVRGNERVTEQIRFFARAIPRQCKSVLVPGCGSGQAAYAIAARIAPRATVVALDLSGEALRLARAINSHARITYLQADFVESPPAGRWEAIVLPDVYEHIPRAQRPVLHAVLHRLLADNGRILLTIPTPGKQESLRIQGSGLQIVDEDVTAEDLFALSRDVEGDLTYFAKMSIWQTNDYAHAMIERASHTVQSLTPADRIPIKGWPAEPIWKRARASVARRLHLDVFAMAIRRARFARKLARFDAAG